MNLFRGRVAGAVVCLVVVVGAASLAARAATPNVVASRYDVALDLRPDGSLDVVERITLTIGSTPITWFERAVPDRRTDGLSDVLALMDGRELPVVDDGPGVRLRARRGIEARWEFEPFANGSRTFELRYRAAHVLARDGEGPRLRWAALPARHDYPIAAAFVTLRAPNGALALAVAADGGNIRPSASWQDGLVVTANDLARHRTVTLDVTFGPRTISPVEPAWFITEERSRKLVPAFVIAALTLLVIGAGVLVMVYARTKRTIELGGTDRMPADATEAPPAVATVLLNKGHASGWLALQAAFFRLVRDGQLVVEKSANAKWYSGRAFTVKTGAPGAAAPHERWILDGVAAEGGVADLKRLTSRFMRRQRGFQQTLRMELESHGRLDRERVAAGDGLLIAGFVVMAFAFISAGLLALLLVDRFGAAMLAMPAALLFDAAAFMIAGRLFSGLSESGEREAARWRARVTELRQIIRAKGAGASLAEFERWLPLAIGAGLGGRWLKTFDAQLRDSGTDIAWLKTMGSPEDARASMAMIVAISGASHAGGAGGSSGGASAGGGSSSAG